MRLPSNKLLAVSLTILLVATILEASSASSSFTSTETVVKVEPSLIELGNPAGDPIPMPETRFHVTVKIYNVFDLYGFDLKFKWNTTFLAYVNHSICVPRNTYPDGVLWNPTLPLADEVDTTEGTYWIAYSSIAPAPSFNGTGTVFTMTFEVVNQPYDYETGGFTVDPIDTFLGFLSTDLVPKILEHPYVPIPHTTEHTTIRIWEKRSELTTEPVLKVVPTTVENLPRCKTFDINIWIIGVGSKYDIQRFNITLNFNFTLIEAISLAEGPWPRNYANNTIEILKQINNAEGAAVYAVELVPPRKPDPPTAGILFTVTFNVTYESPTYPPPTSQITLGPTEILDRNMGLILHTTENCTYTAFRPPPLAKFTWTPSGNVLPRGQTITFDASESYHPHDIKLYAWDFGDGNKTTIETPIITHIYTATGTVTVVLNVTDHGNFWNTANATLFIIEPKTFPEISVINPLTGNTNFTFYTNTTSVGFRFNTTISVYNVPNLHAYQIHLDYNSTLLNATRAWMPTWHPQWVFYGKNTSGLSPTFGLSYVEISDALLSTYPTFSGTGILAIIEFEIIYVPTTSEVSCSLNINNADTFLLDPTTNEISSAKTNGYYEYIFEKIMSTISMTIFPSTINFGESTTISGVIDPPRSTNVTLLYKLQGETEWKNLTIAPTNLEGRYSYTWTPPKAGDYTIRVSWPGDQNTNPAENETRLTVAKLNSTITISVNPENITLGSSVTINGTLSPARANANITIEYQIQGQTTWNLIIKKLTDNNGKFSHVWTPTATGNYTIRVSWPGDQNTHQAESEHKKVKVEAQPTEIVPYIVAGIITVAIIVVALTYLVKMRKPK